MTQFTCKGVKQINNRISFKHLYHSYLSAFFISVGVPNGEFPEILIAGQDFIVLDFFHGWKILKVDGRDERDPQNREKILLLGGDRAGD